MVWEVEEEEETEVTEENSWVNKRRDGINIEVTEQRTEKITTPINSNNFERENNAAWQGKW